jgi:hypothetical protein
VVGWWGGGVGPHPEQTAKSQPPPKKAPGGPTVGSSGPSLHWAAVGLARNLGGGLLEIRLHTFGQLLLNPLQLILPLLLLCCYPPLLLCPRFEVTWGQSINFFLPLKEPGLTSAPFTSLRAKARCSPSLQTGPAQHPGFRPEPPRPAPRPRPPHSL